MYYKISKDYINNVLEGKKNKQNTKIWTVDEIRKLIKTNDRFVVNSLIMLHSFQTEEEKEGKHTKEYNGVGFNLFDSEPLTNIFDYMAKHLIITVNQVNYVRDKIYKYSRQLTDIANS